MFESEGGYSVEKVDEEIYMGTINCELGVRLREGKLDLGCYECCYIPHATVLSIR